LPTTVPVRYIGKDRINTFQVGNTAMRRLVSESYKVGNRSHMTPTTKDPIMLTSPSNGDIVGE
jgi:hypothetical protein